MDDSVALFPPPRVACGLNLQPSFEKKGGEGGVASQLSGLLTAGSFCMVTACSFYMACSQGVQTLALVVTSQRQFLGFNLLSFQPSPRGFISLLCSRSGISDDNDRILCKLVEALLDIPSHL